jgi:hypothetical protein
MVKYAGRGDIWIPGWSTDWDWINFGWSTIISKPQDHDPIDH